MSYTTINNVHVWGEPIDNAVEQMVNAMKSGAEYGALMADHHLGYSVPIGGVIAYHNAVSPSAVGYDIACGNAAARLNIKGNEAQKYIVEIMDEIWEEFSFGVGQENKHEVKAELFNDPVWDEIPMLKDKKELARKQLGTIGSGNHFIDLFVDDDNYTWVGVHFGSRGLGHKIASHYIKAGGGKDGMHVQPVVLYGNTELGKEYWRAMQLAGQYAYRGRDWVVARVAHMLGAKVEDYIHNNHNFAWIEAHADLPLTVIRKGATPAWPGQRGFIGGSMGDVSVIVKGLDTEESKTALRSTVHGAGRVMSRRQAAGKTKYDKKLKQRIQVTEGEVSDKDMMEWINRVGVELRGAGVDESPQVYKRLPEVLAAHDGTIEIGVTLHPIGVAMAGKGR